MHQDHPPPETTDTWGSSRAIAQPPGHGLHVVLPSSSWYLPASHRTQLSCLTSGLTVPGAHSDALAEPTGQNVPSRHGMQSLSLVIVIDAFV